MSIGLSIIVTIIIGSLLACVGFEAEWAISQLSDNAELARIFTLGTGWLIVVSFTALAAKKCQKLEAFSRKSLLAFAAICAITAVLTPRSYTYDTGLYHLPVIIHLQELGLENNLGWVHSRYGFFNLLLYGQAMAARVTGLSHLPTLNSLIIAATLTHTYEYIRRRRSVSVLACCLIVAGAILIPSESTESYHSYNADFALGCVFLVCMISVLNWTRETASDRLAIRILILSLPLIKLSGLLLCPLLVIPLMLEQSFTRERRSNMIRCCLTAYVMVSAVVFGTFGYISTGYLAYPISQTGPLRPDAIEKEAAVNDSTLSMVAWARYAYSDQLAEIKAVSDLVEWFPKWSRSLNGKRMLSYLSATAIIFLIASLQSRAASYITLIGFLFLFWIFSILVLPPDPRFYWGPVLATLWLGTDVATARLDSVSLIHAINKHRLPVILITSWACISLFTYFWRDSEYTHGEYPAKGVYNIPSDSRKPYIVPAGRQLLKSREGACWDNVPPCTP